MYTLDKMCPISACQQCGKEKFEPCGLIEEDCSLTNPEEVFKNRLDQDSEMLNSL